MQRKIILIILIIFIFSILLYSKKNNEILDSVEVNKNDMLSIMVESEAGTGNYNDASSFPSIGYYLNKNLSKCVNGSKISFSDGNLIIKGNKTDRCYAYFDKDELGSICKNENMAKCFIKNYKKDETIYYHDLTLENGAQDDSYRYAGSFEEVKNYVCLDGRTTTTGACENGDANLYRIIGIFKNENNDYELKLIKYDYAFANELGNDGAYSGLYANKTSNYIGNKENLKNIAGYYWNSNDNALNDWSKSNLNNINLNNNFIKFLKDKVDTDNLITNHSWKIGGCNNSALIPKDFYNYEMGIVKENNSNFLINTVEINEKIGLLYVSDYGYAISPSSISNWTINLNNYSTYTSNNWMYMGLSDWTITRNSNYNNQAWRTIWNGKIGITTGYEINVSGFGIRPSFYINSLAKLKSGSGTQTNPYRLDI